MGECGKVYPTVRDCDRYPVAVERNACKCKYNNRGFGGFGGFGGLGGIDIDDIILIGIIIVLIMQKEECDWGSVAGCVHLLMA